jgi:hypothetical protein
MARPPIPVNHGRHPAHEQGTDTRRAVWQVIREQRDFTTPALVATTGLPETIIRRYLKGWEAACYLERVGEPPKSGQPQPYRLIRDIGNDPPLTNVDGTPMRRGQGRRQIWRTLKILKGDFSCAELAWASSTEECPVSEVDVQSYCYHLHQAGYLQRTRAPRRGLTVRYRMIPARWTGPRPPMVERTLLVYDPNRHEVVHTGKELS